MLEIAKEMVERFDIPHQEAIGRLNDWFKGSDFTNPYNLIYHEDAVYWANHIYYDYDVKWRDPEWMATHVARPKAYPPQTPKRFPLLEVAPKIEALHKNEIATAQTSTHSDTILSEQACLMLETAGWYPERRIDTSEQYRDLSKIGIMPSPIVADFLERFDRLIIHIESPIQDSASKRSHRNIKVHVSYFLYDKYKWEIIPLFEEYLGERIFRIAFRSDTAYPMFVYISSSGAIYTLFEGWFYWYASSPITFFNKISAGDETYKPVFRYDESQ